MRAKILMMVFFFVTLAAASFSQDTKSLIQQGDELLEQREDMAKAREAQAKYLEALIQGENPYQASWRMARVLYWTGDHTADKNEKKKLFSQGIYYAKKAVALAPDKPDGHFWLGVNYGVYGEARGVLKSLFLVKPIKEEMNKVIAIDRSYEWGGSDRVLGRVYYELPGFAGGSKTKSLEHLLKSKEFGPQVGLTRIYLADTYLALDDIDKAREELEYVINMDPDPLLIPETKEEKEMARKMLGRKEFQKKN